VTGIEAARVHRMPDGLDPTGAWSTIDAASRRHVGCCVATPELNRGATLIFETAWIMSAYSNADKATPFAYASFPTKAGNTLRESVSKG
jgi:hypothetical protein